MDNQIKIPKAHLSKPLQIKVVNNLFISIYNLSVVEKDDRNYFIYFVRSQLYEIYREFQ